MSKSWLEERKHKPTYHEIYWCNKCDLNQVDSEKPKTGDFFIVFGHTFDSQKRRYSDEYRGVMLALCKECQSK